MHLPAAVLWVDPGRMTGLAALVNSGTLFYCDEYGFMESGTYIERFCQNYGSRCAVGWEAYVPNVREPQTNAADALEMIGVTRRYSTMWLCQLLPPAQRHTPKPPERKALQQLGWWVPGKNDAQSAACHMMRWLLREHIAPPHVMAAVQSTTGER